MNRCLATITLLDVAWPFLLLLVCTVVFIYGWWMMSRHPERWAKWVEKENSYWVRKGWVSAKTSESIQRWEKGPFLKNFAAFAAIIGLVGTLSTGFVVTRLLIMQHHRLRMPYNPVLDPHWKPPVIPKQTFPPAYAPRTNHVKKPGQPQVDVKKKQ
jgi:hypothetical protein